FSASPEATAIRVKIDQASEEAVKANAQVGELVSNGKADEALAMLLQKVAPATERWQQAMAEYSGLQRRRAATTYADTNAEMARGRALLIGGGLAVVVFSILLG
ncbi:MCP four helix bundle domain-containing protein, partial [Pseudomonas viridiflava]|uniref:hypothetical protein n=1 Tax=Pseudomonas viridiflava TaxID=33069 RepID=UPI001CA8221F